MGFDAKYVFHKETELGDTDAVVVPGGFSYGDYLRAGAIAGSSPIAPAIKRFGEKGGPVLGICNGFQVLTELKLLPGALTRNKHMCFECRDVHATAALKASGFQPVTQFVDAGEGDEPGTVLRLPIAHAEGRYQCDEKTLKTLQDKDRIAFRYCLPNGSIDKYNTVNGSVEEIAGIYNARRNVLGLMPHSERASEDILGNADGRKLFESLAAHLAPKDN